MKASSWLVILSLFAMGCSASTSGSEDAGTSCGDAGNDPSCPATFATSYARQPCAPVGLTCSYPGQGDVRSCSSAAGLRCNGDGGVEAGAWIFTQ